MSEPDGFDFKFDFHNHINFRITVNTLDADTVSWSKSGLQITKKRILLAFKERKIKLVLFSAGIKLFIYYAVTDKIRCLEENKKTSIFIMIQNKDP